MEYPFVDFDRDLIVFDSIKMIWDINPIGELLYPKMGYTTTLLPNGIIIYIGGREQLHDNLGNLTLVQMNHVSKIKFKSSLMSVM